MTNPISPAPVEPRRVDALPPYLSNGIIGIRSPGVPYLKGTTMVGGFAGVNPADDVEGFARAPYAFALDVKLDGVAASSAPEWVRDVRQRYDFATAELHTSWTFQALGTTARVEIVAFCSKTLPAVAATELRVVVDRPAALEITAGFDATNVPGLASKQEQPQDQGPNEGVDGGVCWRAPGDIDVLGVAYTTAFRGDAEAERRPSTSDERGWFATTYALRARAERGYRVSLLTAYVPQASHHRPDEHARRLAASAAKSGFDGLREDNRAHWREAWRGRIEIDGADQRWQAITDASLFYLLTSVHASSIASMSLFGLAYWPNYHYYHGHVMWDIETFTLPPLLFLDPPAARAVLHFRHRHLEAARQNAGVHGWRGALYPWEACPQHGEEATPGARPYTEDHVTADVGLAFASYVHATGDVEYAEEFAWPVLQAVAEWAESRVELTDRGYELLRTVGPRESYESVDNDAFTNMATARVLREAIRCAELTGKRWPKRWQDIADGLVVPTDSRRGAIINHDGARLDDVQGGVPEGAAGLFPVGYEVAAETELATYRYAAVEQAPLYVGAPMLSALTPVYAARANRRDLAAQLLERGFGDFVTQPFLEPAEHPLSRTDLPVASPMFANLSGYLTALLFGFTGIRLNHGDPEGWATRPVTMPAGWRGLSVERISARGGEHSLDARHGAIARISPRTRGLKGRAAA
jgi:trehalose/maltose hydrolase-like predicted phosphorylase